MFVRHPHLRIAAESYRIAAGRVALAVFTLLCAIFISAAAPRFSFLGEAASALYLFYTLVT